MDRYHSRRTQQAPDRLLFRGVEFATIDPFYGRFSPRDQGIETREISTACWRGFFATYTVQGDRLLLTKVQVRYSEKQAAQAKDGKGPLLFGKPAVFQSDRLIWLYDNLAYPIEDSAVWVVGTEFDPKYRQVLATDPGYRNVRELEFQKGRLVSTTRCPVITAVNNIPTMIVLRPHSDTIQLPFSTRLPVTPTRPKTLPLPSLPEPLRRQKFQPSVEARFSVSTEGTSVVTLTQGSGNRAVDDFIIPVLRQWQWAPALNGKTPVAAEYRLQVYLDSDV